MIAAAGPIQDVGARVLLDAHASLTVAASLVALVATVAAALGDRPPARWFIAGAFCVSLGANLTGTRWLAAPLVVLGVLGLAVRELERAFAGVTIGARGVTLHRPLKDPLTVAYEDVQAVHTSLRRGTAGTLILETDHGTVTARDVPGAADLQARIEARMGTFDVDDPEEAARRARKTIQELVRGAEPT